jgi:hypothetical protein
MITIPVRVCGDHWVNPGEVSLQLDTVAGTKQIILDLQFEGPGLDCLGVVDTINKYCCKYQVNPTTVLIDNWCNNQEILPYTTINLYQRSHFFSRSKNYWLDTIPQSTNKNVFGYFIGRRSIPRAVAMYQLHRTYPTKILFSCLKNTSDAPWLKPSTGVQLDQLEDWLIKDLHEDFCAWWETDPIGSIDNHRFEDSYVDTMNTNLDLLTHYQDFDIELVSESYTRGLTFFPTEKTVRPIMAAKPMMVYGPVEYLVNLQKMGFETYNKLWDESYDLLEGPPRWQSMEKIINKIMNMNETEYKELIYQANKIAVRNRNHLSDIVKLK